MSSPPKFQTDETATGEFRPVSIERIRQWVALAKPNARIEYGRGRHLKEACSHALGEWMREVLSERGYVTLHQIPAERGMHYIAQRTQKPFVKGTAL
ncbi:hypothetical protein DXH95_02970 [Sphingorhabdus pulchriflava]|uniref:Uncharacterized protein n=1 Tax=Sphingorhabdus pulchriflava TaxID=2292257 RepID=A0A371BG73_9SPHN|nr:hypothetical protein [Sphingorhabdus pulchriflava]RDV06403.1 hypothetical protein DXH95_02970 [Sphingorhabdus pulchriflava]